MSKLSYFILFKNIILNRKLDDYITLLKYGCDVIKKNYYNYLYHK